MANTPIPSHAKIPHPNQLGSEPVQTKETLQNVVKNESITHGITE